MPLRERQEIQEMLRWLIAYWPASLMLTPLTQPHILPTQANSI